MEQITSVDVKRGIIESYDFPLPYIEWSDAVNQEIEIRVALWNMHPYDMAWC